MDGTGTAGTAGGLSREHEEERRAGKGRHGVRGEREGCGDPHLFVKITEEAGKNTGRA
jgi:hypothetical protein